MQIRLKRAYEKPAADDGFRVLIDRLWPRGIRKNELQLDGWLKEIAPTGELRQWFGHDPGKWEEFKQRYFTELDGRNEPVEELLSMIRTGPVTLVYGASDAQHNHAAALQEYLEKRHERESPLDR